MDNHEEHPSAIAGPSFPIESPVPTEPLTPLVPPEYAAGWMGTDSPEVDTPATLVPPEYAAGWMGIDYPGIGIPATPPALVHPEYAAGWMGADSPGADVPATSPALVPAPGWVGADSPEVDTPPEDPFTPPAAADPDVGFFSFQSLVSVHSVGVAVGSGGTAVHSIGVASSSVPSHAQVLGGFCPAPLAVEYLPAVQDLPARQGPPALQYFPVPEGSPAPEDSMALQYSPASEDSPALQYSPAPEDSPALQYSLTPQGPPAPGQPQLPTTTGIPPNLAPVSDVGTLDRIRSVPALLSLTYIRGHRKGSTNYHYLLPPPPAVNPVHLQGGGVLAREPLLPVSDDTRKGLLRDVWLCADMDRVWEELMMSLIAEYTESIGDVGLSVWEWKWVKTEWNMETISPDASLKDIIQLFLETEPPPGTPLIMSPIAGDDIPYSEEPSVEFEVPVSLGSSYSGGEISPGNNQINMNTNLHNLELMISNVSPLRGWCRVGNGYMLMESHEQNLDDGVRDENDRPDDRPNEGDTAYSPNHIVQLSPVPLDIISEEPVEERPLGGTGVMGAGSDLLRVALPTYWVRIGNAYMLMGESS